MKKLELIKKTYSKPEVEFMAFNYYEIVSASEGGVDESKGTVIIDDGSEEEEEEVEDGDSVTLNW